MTDFLPALVVHAVLWLLVDAAKRAVRMEQEFHKQE